MYVSRTPHGAIRSDGIFYRNFIFNIPLKNEVKIFSILLFAGFISFSVSGSNGPQDPTG